MRKRLPTTGRRSAAATALGLIVAAAAALPALSQLGPLDLSPLALPRKLPLMPQRAPALEDLLPRTEFNFTFLTPVPLKGVRIPGLGERGVELLGFNYFVVVNNPGYKDMAELYRENRLRGKSNFVTADAIVHPYFAFTNRAIASFAEKKLASDLEALLQSLLEASAADYREAEDADVREDIGRNMAYLSVALRLLNPAFQPPAAGDCRKLADSDLAHVLAGKKAVSAIFDYEEDFASYTPVGWYTASRALQGFYRARQWLSRMSYPLSDATVGAEGKSANSFRRSVLLFRALETASVGGKPALERWNALKRGLLITGTPLPLFEERTLTPSEYKAVFKTASGDLGVTLQSLSEPFFRTKLMLTVRKQKPVKLGATSIFEIEGQGRASDRAAAFRLFPVVGDPELPWLKLVARYWKEDGLEGPVWPLSLMVLHSRGAGQATNILAGNAWRMDPQLVHLLPDLGRSVNTRLPGGQVKPVDDRRWRILSSYFKPYGEAAQSVLRTESWMNRSMESAFAGWVDSHVSIDRPDQEAEMPGAAAKAQEGDTNGQGMVKGGVRTTGGAARRASYHYLEPRPELYRHIKEDAQKLASELAALEYSSADTAGRLAEFARFAERLERISETELRGQPLPPQDLTLLGHIDVFLEKIVVPLAGTMAIVPSDWTKAGAAEKPGSSAGLSFALGHPGLLYIILQNGDRSTLARGAVYTYYEVPGAPIKPEHWQRKLEFNLVKPPVWADKFDIVQERAPARTRSTAGAR